ncbi:MAG TPA: SURF1 family protein [Kineosporiaceae bacterium]|nr:SURF1 family protein [Kineosporiaceae bacterium]
MTADVDDRPQLRPATVLAAFRLLTEWVWLRALLLVIVFATASTFLGRWQWGRHVDKDGMIGRVEANYSSPAVPLEQLLATPATPLPAAQEWRQVRIGGSYDVARTTLVRNRSLNGQYGYEVLVPLRTGPGTAFVVDRGWLPNGRTGAEPDSLPAAPSGPVQLVVRLRPGENPSGQTPPPGQAMRIDLPELASRWGVTTYQAYGVLASESPAPAVVPQLLPRPDLDQGPHLAYALQWWVFAVGGFGLLGYFGVREVQNRQLRARGIDPGAVRKRRSRPEPEEEEW